MREAGCAALLEKKSRMCRFFFGQGTVSFVVPVGRIVVRTRGRQGNAGAGSAKGAPPPRLPENEAGCAALLEREAGCAGCTRLRHYAQAMQHCIH